MAKNVQLLLVRSVENLGIVGDIVKVRTGFARNFLLPQGYAQLPTPSKIEALKEARNRALSEVMALRSAREELLERMHEVRVTLVRSCNVRGILYGSVTQRDIADGLSEGGFDVGVRSIRLANAIRRVGEYQVPIQFDKELRTDITVVVEPDQPLEEREEMEFDNEGNLIEKPKRAPKRPAEDAEGAGAEAAPAEAAAAE